MNKDHGCRLVFMTLSVSFVFVWTAAPVVAGDCPELVGRWPYGPPFAVATSGDHAYLTSGSAFEVVDLADPAAPRVAGAAALPGIGIGLAVSGHDVYVASGASGLRVVDVEDPSAPSEVAFVESRSEALDVAVADGTAFVSTYGPAGLEVIDVRHPSSPAVVGFVALPGPGLAVAAAGDVVFVAAGEAGLRVVDVSIPAAPVEVASVDLPGWTSDVAVAGVTLFVAGGDQGGFRVFDISLPAMPREVGFLEGSWSAVAVSEGFAHVAGSFGLSVIDVSSPSDPRRVADLFRLMVEDIAVSGGRACVAGSRRSLTEPSDSEGFFVIDVRAPAAPTEVGFLPTAGRSVGVAVADGLAWVADRENGLRAIRLTAPARPVEVGFVDFPEVGNSLNVAVFGGYAYVARFLGGLSSVNARVPSAPTVVATLDDLVYAANVAVAGHFAYVAVQDAVVPSAGPGGLWVVDFSDPAAPVEVASVDLGPYAMAVAVDGPLAAVVDQLGGLRMIDIGDPTSPVAVGSLDPGYRLFDVALSGGFAFLAAGDHGLRVVDVHDPSSPVEVGVLDHQGWDFDDVLAVAVSGRYVYLADLYFGLQVVDVSDPTAPVEVGSYATLGRTRTSFAVSPTPVDVAVADGLVVVADDLAGLTIFRECGEHLSADPRVSFVPAAAVATGAQGAFFQTDLELDNRGAEPAEVMVQWLPRGRSNPAPTSSDPIALAPGQSVRYENVLGELFGLGPDSFGALRLAASTEDVIGMSRTYNLPAGDAAGTFGQGLAAVRATEMIAGTEPRRILFLSEDDWSRANVGCVNGTDGDVAITVAAFGNDGPPLGSETVELGPYGNRQLNRVLGSWAPVSGYVDVQADREDALFTCYGSVLDNVTSDPTTILPQVPWSELTYIPAVALSAGLQGSFFTSDLELNNVASTDVSYRMLWLPRGEDNSDPIVSDTYTLAAGAGVRYANVLGEVFGLEPNQVGALAVEAGGPGLLAMNRTCNTPSATGAGTFGQELAGVPPEELMETGERRRIIFMNETDDLRSNVGCLNGGAGNVRINLELFNAEGGWLEVRTMDLPPRSNNQITRVFRDHAPISAGYVDVWTDTPGAAIYCYGSVLDNLSSDPTTVLPQ